jgi:hypothetical protein
MNDDDDTIAGRSRFSCFLGVDLGDLGMMTV